MKVSDKDLDQLFSSKLGDMEMEPSASVWSNIADELDGKKEEEVKTGLPFMKIAAGIVLFMAVGLFFIRPEHQKIELRASTVNTENVIPNSPAIAQVQPSVDYTESPDIAETETSAGHRSIKPSVNHVENSVTSNIDTAQSSSQYIAAANRGASNQVITQTPTMQARNEGMVPDNIVRPPITKGTNVVSPNKEVPVMASLNNSKAETAKKHRIHSLGDLLNVVIAKVDKREDKLIEFTNTGDDDSFNVSGVNLGLLKAKKEK